MSPFDLLAQGQNGQVIENLARQFGLSNEQAADAVKTMLPTLTRGIQANIQTKGGLESLLRALGSGKHARYYEDPNIIGDEAVQADGRAILGHVLGSDRQSRALAKQASYATGIGGAILEQVLPYLVSILMGMIFKNGGGNIEDILRRLPNGGGLGGGGGRGGGGAPDMSNFPKMPDTGGGGGNYVPQQHETIPFDEVANEVSRRGPLPGGFTGSIRDAIGSALGARTGGIIGWIIKFIVLRFGWRILRGIVGMFLGGR
ncbi:MAG: DUF937 domain-containing protein [Hyphomicrobiaceae bacterium]